VVGVMLPAPPQTLWASAVGSNAAAARTASPRQQTDRKRMPEIAKRPNNKFAFNVRSDSGPDAAKCSDHLSNLSYVMSVFWQIGLDWASLGLDWTSPFGD
jgi:hypothetical protein